MPILTLQRQMRELGRIRTGVQVASRDGKKRRPAKLETFRLTSESNSLIVAAAAAYGGKVSAWQNGDRSEWEVITETAVVDVIVPRGEPVTQWFELWRGGGCERRCDGITNVLSMTPCACPADPAQRVALAAEGEACKATTRLNVMLPALPDLGVWRIESHGYYAAVELAGAADVLALASAAGLMIPARLRLEQREKKVPGQPTNKYAVPILEFVDTKMADLPLLAAGEGPGSLPPARPAVPALPATTLPERSDFRAPLERPEPHPSLEVAQDSIEGGATAARPVARDAGALCGLDSPYDDGTTCGMAAGHLDEPRAPRIHKVIGPGGEVKATWQADKKEGVP